MVAGSETGPIARPRVLIVEDEPLIALMLADMLADLGYDVAANVTQVAEALSVLADTAIDAALLDVNLGTQKIDPVADLLAERGTPFLFTTGYGDAGVPPMHIGRPILQKPFHFEELSAALRSLIGSAL